MGFLADVVKFVGTFAAYLFMARLLLQVARADFFNPISQMIARFTSPVVNPLQAVLKPVGAFSTAAFVIVLAIQMLIIYLDVANSGVAIPMLSLLVVGLYKTLQLALYVYLFSFFVIFITSWVAPGSSHPGIRLVYQIADPLLKPVRRLIPPMGGLDFSLMITMFILFMLDKHLLSPVFAALERMVSSF